MTYTSSSESTTYSIPKETAKIFRNGILNNPLIAPMLPTDIEECAKTVRFEGTDSPSLPINWRFAESISALKGLEAAMTNVLLKRKYNVEAQEAVINTDHAQLFLISPLLSTLDPFGLSLNYVSLQSSPAGQTYYNSLFKNCDIHHSSSSPYRLAATNIYRCKDDRYFHIHGSLNPEPTQDALGLPHEKDVKELEDAWKPYGEKIAGIDAGDVQRLISEEYKQAGTICLSTQEFKASAHGRANAHVALYEIHDVKNEKQRACWWPDSAETSARRPLAGLKIVDLTRIIAAPAMTRGLAELGASVMRVTAEHVPDMSSMHLDLNWGKWNCHLDFREEGDREKLRALVMDADVVVQGYRPGVLDKHGFGVDDLLELTKKRDRGLIVVRENCYGWNGPWAQRSGWEQISDAVCGVSMEYGRAMGNNEPVTPVFPNSDYSTGVAGIIGVLNAIIRRGAQGGSYKVDVALNYYVQWLIDSVGTYPNTIWQDVWARNGKQVFRHYHNMSYMLPRVAQSVMTNSREVLFRPEFLQVLESGAIGKEVRIVKPAVQYPGGMVELKYNVGTRGNGVDKPWWPEDLMTEIVA